MSPLEQETGNTSGGYTLQVADEEIQKMASCSCCDSSDDFLSDSMCEHHVKIVRENNRKRIMKDLFARQHGSQNFATEGDDCFHASMMSSSSVTPIAHTSCNTKDDVMRIPYNAPGMHSDHNLQFENRSDMKHGEDLVCSYPACCQEDTNFVYYTYCCVPVAKRNFQLRHLHEEVDETTHLDLPEFSNMDLEPLPLSTLDLGSSHQEESSISVVCNPQTPQDNHDKQLSALIRETAAVQVQLDELSQLFQNEACCQPTNQNYQSGDLYAAGVESCLLSLDHVSAGFAPTKENESMQDSSKILSQRLDWSLLTDLEPRSLDLSCSSRKRGRGQCELVSLLDDSSSSDCYSMMAAASKKNRFESSRSLTFAGLLSSLSIEQSGDNVDDWIKSVLSITGARESMEDSSSRSIASLQCSTECPGHLETAPFTSHKI